jgi:hypothetical protein
MNIEIRLSAGVMMTGMGNLSPSTLGKIFLDE